jgi:hypothetical protein
VHLVSDRVCCTTDITGFLVSIGFRRRSRELAWKALDHRGKSNLDTQQQLLKQALALLPERVRLSVHGDSELRGSALFRWLRERHGEAMLGVQGTTYVSVTRDGSRQLLKDWLIDRATVVYLQHSYLTEDAHGRLSVIAWWAKDDDDDWIVRGVMTKLRASWQTYLPGRRRLWIETLFRDWQSGGFHLDRCGLTDRDRLAGLLLPLAIA